MEPLEQRRAVGRPWRAGWEERMSPDVVRVDCAFCLVGLYEVVPSGLSDLSKLFLFFFSSTNLKRARDWPGNGLGALRIWTMNLG